jgi:hypothetical protein
MIDLLSRKRASANLPCVDDLRKAADEKPEDAEALFNLGEGYMCA